MSQNDKILKNLGLPILTKEERIMIRSKWQNQTWDDMILSLHQYGKYVMLRPTGFGKTYTCACACNIGEEVELEQLNKKVITEDQAGVLTNLLNGQIRLNSGTIIENTKLSRLKDKKVIVVYVSDILKKTIEEYDYNGNKPRILPDKNGNSRIQYETYNMVSRHWDDEDYLVNTLDIKNVGLVIFDEVQRMGAEKTSKALDTAIKLFSKYGIYYIGATATVERATGLDVCDKYFTNTNKKGDRVYCWGEHIYTLSDAFREGLILPPHYVYIDDDNDKIKKTRHSRKSLLDELKVERANCKNPLEKDVIFKDMKQLEHSVIANADKIIHDSILKLYNCDPKYVDKNKEKLKKATFNSLDCPKELPEYMRFLVFTPDRKSMAANVKDKNIGKTFGGIVSSTLKDFKSAFARYGYDVRFTVISSYNNEEKNNVRLIDNYELAEKELLELSEKERKAFDKQVNCEGDFVSESDIKLGKAVVPIKGRKIIDLIFSINMLNVGYHVNNITGLVLKRWTGSNQIYYQQLGRCLSVDSDIIPIIFDFVKSIDSRGIKEPLFTLHDNVRDTTENADGTKNIYYLNSKKSSKKPVIKNAYLLDEQGNLVNPKECNTIDSHYVNIEVTDAGIEYILERCRVYEVRKNSRELFNHAYKTYRESYKVRYGKLLNKPDSCMVLWSALHREINTTQNDLGKDFTMNFKAFVLYLKSKNCRVYIEYKALDDYLKYRRGEKSKHLSDKFYSEINTLLACSKRVSDSGNIVNGARLALLVNEKHKKEFENNTYVKDILKDKLARDSIVYYEY